MFNVVLVRPEIPPNTGNIGRLCVATQSTLHLVRPLGFSLEHRQLRRAGLDYWSDVNVKLWDCFDTLQRSQSPGTNYFFLTTKSNRPYYEAGFQPGDFLVFGAETKGLPENLLTLNEDRCFTIPMHGTRSLNLATAVAIVLFEAMRQQRPTAQKSATRSA
jgi:tRNA (cytidine/uridine-2'-O-)-methyltransferase